MKTGNNKNFTQSICTILMVLVLTLPAFAYPPDNAAVLYYRASLLYESNDVMMNKVLKFNKGDIKIDDEIRQYVEANQNAIKSFVDAGDSPNCDWGVDYSRGIGTVMPPFAPLRNIARIVRAQAKITAESGDYNRALDLCLSLHKAGNDIAGGGNLIFHLVGISIDAMTNQCIAEILGEMSDNPETLILLRGQIYEVTGKFPSLSSSLNRDMNTCMQDMTKERVEHILNTSGDIDSKEKAKIIRRADEKFFRANKQYFLAHKAALLSAIELPYPQSYEQLVRLKEKLSSDSKNNQDAILTEIFVPAIDRVLCLDVRCKTHFNAIKTAVEIYLIKARTGKLPDTLPDGLPGDLFSGKNFKYEKTDEGFTLHCQGKDLSKDEIYKYEFKVKK